MQPLSPHINALIAQLILCQTLLSSWMEPFIPFTCRKNKWPWKNTWENRLLPDSLILHFLLLVSALFLKLGTPGLTSAALRKEPKYRHQLFSHMNVLALFHKQPVIWSIPGLMDLRDIFIYKWPYCYYGMNVHAAKTMNPNNFGVPLTSSVAPASGPTFNLSFDFMT